jgi:hypothetical protein
MQPEHVLSIIALAIAGIIVTAIALRYRTRVQYQMTVRAAIDKGQALTPEFLAGLTEKRPAPIRNSNRDLRFGVVAVALGERVMMAIGNVPFLVGLALIALWRFQPRD